MHLTHAITMQTKNYHHERSSDRFQGEQACTHHDLAERPELLDVKELLVHVAKRELSMTQFLDQLLVVLQLQLTKRR